MKAQNDIHDRIINYFLYGGREVADPVLAEWLAEEKSNLAAFNQLKKIWYESKYYMNTDAFDTEKAWQKIHTIHENKQLVRKRLKNIYYAVAGVAASLLIMFTLSVMGLIHKEPDTLVSMTADYGNRSEIILSDGSKVKLNAGSDISYSYNRKDKIREVRFQGEGFFEVSKSKDPFIIKLQNGLEVKVLGTSFNLQAYTDDQIIQTALVEGRIELNYQNKTLQMNAGEMAIFDQQSKELKRSEGILAHTYGWMSPL